MEPNFSGWATRANLECTDGLVILPDAFKHNDGQQVPLVWQHGHSDPDNVLGHAILEHRADGVYAYCYFNGTDTAKQVQALIEHKDVNSLSIRANRLKMKAKEVLHGFINEVSVVIAGANPGAFIDNINFQHSDNPDSWDEAIIYTGFELEHQSPPDEEATLRDVYETLDDAQKTVVQYMVGQAYEAGQAEVSHSDESDAVETAESSVEEETSDAETSTSGSEAEQDTETDSEDSSNSASDADASASDDSSSADAVSAEHSQEDEVDSLEHKEGNTAMSRNLFEDQANGSSDGRLTTLTHDQFSTILSDAKKMGSFRDSFLEHAVEYGIENIDILFPDAVALSNTPELVARKMEWVNVVIDGVHKSPFARIKTIHADITLDEARAKGYVKGNLKKEEWFSLQKRTTTPTTIYKKQKLDRDDVVDITELDVIAWLKQEMRIMLDEEIARAILVGDGREIDDDDKVNETHIRPIAYDDSFYAHPVTIAAGRVGDEIVEDMLRARVNYRGLGEPVCFLTEEMLTDILLAKDDIGRRLYANKADLATTLQVSRLVTVPVMASLTTDLGELVAIQVNLSDYTVGANKGGAVSFFDDFDLDYNQLKYLLETRISGALRKFKSALVFSRTAGTLVTPDVPTFNATTGVVTIPATVGVVYEQDGVVVSSGAQSAISAGATTEVVATPDTAYYFPHNFDADWEFTRDA